MANLVRFVLSNLKNTEKPSRLVRTAYVERNKLDIQCVHLFLTNIEIWKRDVMT